MAGTPHLRVVPSVGWEDQIVEAKPVTPKQDFSPDEIAVFFQAFSAAKGKAFNSGATPAVDFERAEGHAKHMNDITREELNAKLETIEVKMDARIGEVASKIDSFLTAQAERDQRFGERMSASIALSDEWNQKFRMLTEQSVQAAASAEASAKEAATLKNHFWASVGAQILAVLAILVGVYFANQANVLSAVSTTVSVFQAGKEQAQKPDVPASQEK